MATLDNLVLTFLSNALWQVALLGGATALATRLLRSAPARYHHALWVATLLLSVSLPVVSLRTFPGRQTGETVQSPPASARALDALQVPSTPKLRSAASSHPNHLPAPPWAPLRARWARMLRPRRLPFSIPPGAASLVVASYLIFMLYRLAWLAWAWRQTKIVRAGATRREIPSRMAAIAAHACSALRLREVEILCSSRVAGPQTLGIRRPAIILPPRLFESASVGNLTAAIGHEMAHVARGDFLLNLLSGLLLLPIAFHPVAAFLKRRIDAARELACDELVAGRLMGASAYAHSIVDMARSIAAQSSQPGYSLGVFDANILEERVMKLLDERPHAGARRAKVFFASAFVFLAGSCLAASAISLSVAAGARSEALALSGEGASHPHFKGRWVMDKTRSRIDGLFPRSYMQVIEQHGDQVRIINAWEEWAPLRGGFYAGECSFRLRELLLTPDGAVHSGNSGDLKFQSKTQWEDGKLITDLTCLASVEDSRTKARSEKAIVESRWVRYFPATGDVHILEVTNRHPAGRVEPSYDAKLVFVRDPSAGTLQPHETEEKKSGPISGTAFDHSGARAVRAFPLKAASQSSEPEMVQNDPCSDRYWLPCIIQSSEPQTEQGENLKPAFYIVDTGVPWLKPVRKVSPVYPSLAMSARIQGKVVLDATVGADGSVTDLKVERGHPLLVKAALDAVQQWKFAPDPQLPATKLIALQFVLTKHNWSELESGLGRLPELCIIVSGEAQDYPDEARREHVEGQVLVEFTIDQDGQISDVRTLTADSPLLTDSAMKLAAQLPPPPGQQWKAGVAKVLVNFELSDESPRNDGPLLPMEGLVTQAPTDLLIMRQELALYPEEAQKNRLEGDVQVQLMLNDKGEIMDARVVSGPHPLQGAALEAARKWRFAPPPEGPVDVTLTYHFWLPDEPDSSAPEQANPDPPGL